MLIMEALVVLMVVTIGYTSRSCSINCETLSSNKNVLMLSRCDCSSAPPQKKSLQHRFIKQENISYEAMIPKQYKVTNIFNTAPKRQRRNSRRPFLDGLHNNDTEDIIKMAYVSSNSRLKSNKRQNNGKVTKTKDELIKFNNDIISKTNRVIKSEYSNSFRKQQQITKKDILKCIEKHFTTLNRNNDFMHASDFELIRMINTICNPTIKFVDRNVKVVEKENYWKSNINSIINENNYNIEHAKLKFTYSISSESVISIESSVPVISQNEQFYSISSKTNLQQVEASEHKSEFMTSPKPNTSFTNFYNNNRTYNTTGNKKLLKQGTSDDLRSADGDETSTPTIISYRENPSAFTNNSKNAISTLQPQNNKNNTAHLKIVKPSKTLQRNSKVEISLKKVTTKKPFKIIVKDLITKKQTNYKAVNTGEEILTSTCRPNQLLNESSLVNSMDKNVFSKDLSLKDTNKTVFSCDKKQRKRYNESDIPIIRIISREFPNDTVSSTIDGTEVLPNNDFKYETHDVTTVKYSDTQLGEREIYQTNNSITQNKHFDHITGNLYFVTDKKRIPARFSQEADGKIRIGLDLTNICQNIIKQQSKSLLSILCKCVQV